MGRTRPRLTVSESQPDFDDLPAGDGILILSPDQVILSATLQAERLLKRRLEPGQSLALDELFPEVCLPQAELAFRETLESGVMRAQVLIQVRLEPDQPRFLKYSISPPLRPEPGDCRGRAGLS